MIGHPSYFRHDEKDVETVIHIDDGIIAGPPAEVAEIKQILPGNVSMKDMGSIDKHGNKFLGKIIKRTEKGFTIQADPEFYDRLLEETGLDQGVSSPTLGTNAMKPAEWEKEAWDEDLDKDSDKHYRKRVGMLRWLVAERPDIMFDAKNVSENLQSPRYRHWQQVKRIVRYLAGTRDYVQKIEVNSDVIANKSVNEHSLVGWSDTDFAGDVECRRSPSCAVLRLGGEAEMYGILLVTFEGLSIRSLLRELGSSVELTTMTDSDAGRAMCNRKCYGKLKHVNIRFLWNQDAVAKKKATLKREPSISCVADLGTKHFTMERFEALRKMVDMEAINDRNGVRFFVRSRVTRMRHLN